MSRRSSGSRSSVRARNGSTRIKGADHRSAPLIHLGRRSSKAKRGGSLRRYVITRIALTIPMIAILLSFVFVILRVAPGDPIEAAYGQKLPPAQIAQIRHNLGLDRPLIVQYVTYLADV